MKLLIALLLCFASTGLQAEVPSYQKYPFDDSPFQNKDPDGYREFKGLQGKEGRDTIKRRLDILAAVHKDLKDWIDGYWMLADLYVSLGSTYTQTDTSVAHPLDVAREYHLKAKALTEKCLEKSPGHAICHFYLGAAIGSIATVDGIFANLTKGKFVKQNFDAGYEAKYNHVFDGGTSFQGLVRYALGIYYRLVPDLFVLQFLFGIRGDMQKSIEMHREAIALDGNSFACYNIMLAVSLLCQGDGDSDHPATVEGNALLVKTSQMVSKSSNDQICIQDAKGVLQDPSKACGYSMAQQQEQIKEDDL